MEIQDFSQDDAMEDNLPLESPPILANISQLPLGILSRIFNYTSTEDLINLAIATKRFYLPSIGQLYRKIVVSDERSLIGDVKTCLSNYITMPHLGTLVHSSKLLHVLSVLNENTNLAYYVKTLVFLDDWERYTGHKILLVYLKKLLIYNLTLDAFVFPASVSTSLADVSALSLSGNFNSISKLSITIGSLDINELITLPNLVSLRVYYYSEPLTNFSFSKLAMALAYGRSLRNLRQLEFSSLESESNDDELLDSLNSLSLGGGGAPAIPPWFDFFKALKQLEQSIALDSFSIRGGWLLDEDMRLLVETVDFHFLRKLKIELNCQFQHSNQVLSMLEVIVGIAATSLTTLILEIPSKCSICQKSLLSALTMTKLTKLSITGRNLPIKEIEEALSTYQQSLVSLKLFDPATYSNDYKLLSKCLNKRMSILNFDYGVSYNNLINLFYFKDTFISDNSNNVVNDYTVHFINDNRFVGLDEFLKYYLNVSFSPFISSNLNLKDLSSLSYLEVFNMKVYIKRDQRLRLFYVTNKEYIQIQ